MLEAFEQRLAAREFRVALSAVSVGRLLHTMGLSPQRPLWRAYQQDPDDVAEWKTREFPAIRAAARTQGATIYFLDEAGVRSDHHAGTAWAPVGQTPVVPTTGARYQINLISAITRRTSCGLPPTTAGSTPTDSSNSASACCTTPPSGVPAPG